MININSITKFHNECVKGHEIAKYKGLVIIMAEMFNQQYGIVPRKELNKIIRLK